jgi:hypothetical protein
MNLILKNINLDWIYTQNVEINCYNVEKLFIAANFFFIVSLQKKCADFLEKNLCSENVIGIRKFALAYLYMELAETAHNFLM